MIKKEQLTEEQVPLVKRAFKQIGEKPGSFSFLSNADKCREFVAVIQGADAVARTDKNYMKRYQNRAQRFVYAFCNYELPKDVEEEAKVLGEITQKPRRERVKKMGKPGVIETLKAKLRTGYFSREELFAHLNESFPGRGEGMKQTITAQLSRLRQGDTERVHVKTEIHENGAKFNTYTLEAK